MPILDQLEEEYGITIRNKESIQEVGHQYINNDKSLLSLNFTRDDQPWVVVFDLQSKEQILNQKFSKEPFKSDFWFENARTQFEHVFFYAKSNTHIYGQVTHADATMRLQVSEMKSNSSVEGYERISVGNVVNVYPWYNGHVLMIENNRMTVYADKHLPVMHFDRIDFISGTPVSFTKLLIFRGDFFQVRSVDTDKIYNIAYDPKNSPTDRVNLETVTSKDHIARVVFKVTTENKVFRKTVEVDIEKYKILSFFSEVISSR